MEKSNTERSFQINEPFNESPEYDPKAPRIGRRDSEPHSYEVSYIKDVLTNNFPDSRTLWDLHHYFNVKQKFMKKVDIKFDISFFLGWKYDNFLSSFNSEKHENRIPILAINILSQSTWRSDIGENLDLCRMIGIRYYCVYAAYHVATDPYRPPFLRVYRFTDGGMNLYDDIRELAVQGDGSINRSAIVDIGPEIPFRIGLLEQKNKIFDGESVFHLVVFHKTRDEMLLSLAEQEKQRAEQEKQRAEQEKQRAEQEKQRAEQEKQRAEQEKQRAEQEKQRAEQEKQRAAKYLELLRKNKISPEE